MRKIVYATLCVTGVLVLTNIFGGFISSHVTAYFFKSFLAELSGVILAFAALGFLRKTSILKLQLHGVSEGLTASSPLLVLNGIILLGYLGDHDPITEPVFNCILFVLFILLVGTFEEVLFRGVIQNAFHDYYGYETPGSVRKAIIAASVVFGLTHLTNILAGGEIVSVIIQAITVIPVGILFGTIYYRSGRNIWLCILVHAINDFVALLRSGILSGGSVVSSINGYSGLKLVSVVLYGAIIVTLMRKEKLQKIA